MLQSRYNVIVLVIIVELAYGYISPSVRQVLGTIDRSSQGDQLWEDREIWFSRSIVVRKYIKVCQSKEQRFVLLTW